MTLAPMLYRASPVEHLRSVSAPHSRNDLEKYTNSISFESRAASPLPASISAVSAADISRPSSTSTQASNAATGLKQHQYNNQNVHTLPHSSTSFSLPGLAALASIASAPSSQLRYVVHNSRGKVHQSRFVAPISRLSISSTSMTDRVSWPSQILFQPCDS
jgi:GATA-binding protein, other eukaryote